MDDIHHQRRSGRVAADPRARDSHGRWVRRTSPADSPGIAEFVFDDTVLEAPSHPAQAESPLYLSEKSIVQDAEGPEQSPELGARPSAAIERASPAAAPPPAPVRVSPAIWLLGVGVLLAGILLAALQRENIGPGPLAQWISPGSPEADVNDTPGIPRIETDPDGRNAAAPADRVVIPPVPRAPTRRPAAPPAVEPAASETIAAGLPQIAPPDSPDPAGLQAVAVPGEPAAAAAAAADTGARGGEEEEGWLKLAEEYQQVGDVARAEELYRRILERGRHRGLAALALGDLYTAHGDYQRAGDYYRESKRLFQEPDRPLPPR